MTMDPYSSSDANRRTFLHRAAGVVMAPPLLAALPAFAQDAGLIAAARKEGKGALYAVTDPSIIQALVFRFKEKYGIEIEVTRLISGALGQRLTAEQDSGSPVADVVMDTDKLLQETLAARRYYAPALEIPGHQAYPDSTKTSTSVIVSHIPYSLVWNTSLVKEAPKGWEDLIDPKNKGRVLFIDPRVGGSPALWHVLMRETYGDAFLRTLGQNGQAAPSAVPGLQRIAAGAQGIYAPGIHQVVVGLVAKNAPIGESFPQPTISSDTNLSIMAKAPHPAIARLLSAFILSVEGQAILNKDGFSPIKGVPGTLPLPKMATPDFRTIKDKIPGLVSLLGLT
jgi:iron(III) transport system substrate-binding protein